MNVIVVKVFWEFSFGELPLIVNMHPLLGESSSLTLFMVKDDQGQQVYSCLLFIFVSCAIAIIIFIVIQIFFV